MEIKERKEKIFPSKIFTKQRGASLKINIKKYTKCGRNKGALNVIFNKIIVQLECKEVGQVWEEEMRGETGSRFIHISRQGLESSKKRFLHH